MGSEKPLILISPPGNMEALEMGYFSVPKLVRELPPDSEVREVRKFIDGMKELRKIHKFIDNTKEAKDELKKLQKFVDDNGIPYSVQESNVWISRKYIDEKAAVFDLVVPLFPRFLEYALPWVLCEYGLYVLRDPNPVNFENFVKNTLKRRRFDYLNSREALEERRWREREKPIHYLNTVITTKNRKAFSYSEPLIEYWNLSKLNQDQTEALQELHDKDFEKAAFDYWKDEDQLVSEHTVLKCVDSKYREEKLIKGCKLIGLSKGATDLLVTSLKAGINMKEAQSELKFSDQMYERYRKQIYRKRSPLEKYLGAPLKEMFGDI